MKRVNKLLIAFILLTLCSGCSINYNIEITKDTVKETIKVTDTVMSNRSKSEILSEYERWIPAYIDNDITIEYDSSIKSDIFEYHEKTIKELDSGYYYTYTYTYPIDKYNKASSTRQAYNKRKFFVDNDYITINTDKENLLCSYSYFNEIKITISIDSEVYKVNHTNADKVSGNNYIWELDRSNCDDSEIILTLDNINPIDNQNDDNKKDNEKNIFSDYVMYIFFGSLALIIFLIYKWFNKLKEKNENFNEDD